VNRAPADPRSRVGEWHGLLHRHPLHDAHARLLLHPHLQLEDDQDNGHHHVLLLLCLCRRVARIRVQVVLVPALMCKGDTEMQRERER
jgi:hypothetical protein